MTDLPALSDLFWLGRYQQQARDRDRHRAEYPDRAALARPTTRAGEAVNALPAILILAALATLLVWLNRWTR